MANARPSFATQLQNIHSEDLQYLEMELNFSDLVSLAFLLFAEERANAEYALQKLLVISQMGNLGACDLLCKYAASNAKNWRVYLVEALCIIGNKRVLRKLGFDWEELRQHFLPHITELSVHIHPLLKALYKVCEYLTPLQTSQMVMDINDRLKRADELLRFYNYNHLEVFLLDWLTRRFINLGERDMTNTDVDVLLAYFKLQEIDLPKQFLMDTIKNNKKEDIINTDALLEKSMENLNLKHNMSVLEESRAQSAQSLDSINNNSLLQTLGERYVVRRAHAGIILIINQKEFYRETKSELKHLLPNEKLRTREGTDVDSDSLKRVFSTFGYQVVEFHNIDHLETLHQIREVVKRSVLYDSLIVCILSHGMEGTIFCANSIPISIIDIEQIITAETLQCKPKFLIIQACQKDEGTKMHFVHKLLRTSFVPKHKKNKKTNEVDMTNSVAPDAYADMVKAMSTLPGFVSMRHTETGTWFIQALCKAIDKYGDRKHILDILVAVTRDVSQKRGNQNEAMLPFTVNTLRKFFYLPPREC